MYGVQVKSVTVFFSNASDNKDRKGQPFWSAQSCLHSFWEKEVDQVALLSPEEYQVLQHTQ